MRILPVVLLCLLSSCDKTEELKQPARVESQKSSAYVKYRHEGFNHLEFNVPKGYELTSDGAETIFLMSGSLPPYIYMQTIGKTEEYQSAREFLAFANNEYEESEYQEIESVIVNGFEAMQWNYLEGEAFRIRAIAIDVGEGILWFYMKSDLAKYEDDAAIFKELKESLDFK